uniref:NADH dehydrogenase subunit 2 n=1 Tax=Dolycoris indicus TaxID=1982384 RepID=UPI0030E57AF5
MKKSAWLFIITMMMSTMIALSSNNWISMWMGLEINMMSFIPIILNKSNKSSAEAAMIYFLIQSLSSMILMIMVLISMMKYSMSNNMIKLMITSSILMKLGAAPFHIWVPEMMSKISWYKGMLLMTWQKLAPLMMISNIHTSSTIINLSTIWSVVIGSIGGINQSSLRKLMGYSSINHLGWMIAINKSLNLWLLYFIIYSVMNMMICQMFSNMKIYFTNQMSSMNMNNNEKISLSIMMLSMGGLPPFIGFMPKWLVIQNMINSKEIIICVIMVMCSLITLMFYMRVMMYMFLTYNTLIKWNVISYNKLYLMIMTAMNLSLPMIMFMKLI